MVYSTPIPLGISKIASPTETQPHSVVEEYQIAFLCDNFFLPGVTIEITLADGPETR